jgi:hypothetical protein
MRLPGPRLPPLAALAAPALLAAGCSLVSGVSGEITGSTQEKKAEQLAVRVQGQVMALADTFVGEMLDASGRIRAGSEEERLAVLGWQVRQANAAYDVASAAAPLESAVDLAILISLGRQVLEAWWIPKVFGESARPLLAVYADLEPRAWALVSGFTDPEQEARLRALVDAWVPAHPELHDVASVRLTEVFAASSPKGLALGTPTEVLQSMGVNPFPGIDPAVAEVQRTRALAERALYFAKRWPRLLELQAQQLALELGRGPGVRRMLDDADRVSRAAESVARTAAELPALVDREREASIRQVLDAMAAQEGRARALLEVVRRTLDAGGSTAVALQGALREFDAVTARLTAPSPPPPPGTTPAPPFDVRDYTRALEQAGRTVRELEGLLRALNQDAPRVAALVGDAGREAEARGRAVVDHAFRRAATLGLILVGAALAAALAYRWAAGRMAARPPGDGPRA